MNVDQGMRPLGPKQRLVTTEHRSGTIRNSAHNFMNPIIEVDGDEATGEWRLIMLYTGRYPDGSLHFSRIIGWYKEQYRRVAGRWLIHRLYCEVEEAAPYALAPERAMESEGG